MIVPGRLGDSAAPFGNAVRGARVLIAFARGKR